MPTLLCRQENLAADSPSRLINCGIRAEYAGDQPDRYGGTPLGRGEEAGDYDAEFAAFDAHLCVAQ